MRACCQPQLVVAGAITGHYAAAEDAVTLSLSRCICPRVIDVAQASFSTLTAASSLECKSASSLHGLMSGDAVWPWRLQGLTVDNVSGIYMFSPMILACCFIEKPYAANFQKLGCCLLAHNVYDRSALTAFTGFMAALLLPRRPPRSPPQSTMLKPNAMKTRPCKVKKIENDHLLTLKMP